MKKVAIFCILALLVLLMSSAIYAQYDPALFSVCAEKDCYVICPSGDLCFCFCISYDGEPLMAPPSDVYLMIECATGCLYLCPAECFDKCSFLVSPDCYSVPGCGREYCWFFRAGGCCLEARITLHMKNDPNPFYEIWVPIKSTDIDCDGDVDVADESLFLAAMGTSDVCADLNCDGTVDASDMAIFYSHFGHNCEDWIGTEESSWGAIKSIYKR